MGQNPIMRRKKKYTRGIYLDVKFLDIVDGANRQAAFTRQRQTLGEWTRVERAHGVDLPHKNTSASTKRHAIQFRWTRPQQSTPPALHHLHHVLVTKTM